MHDWENESQEDLEKRQQSLLGEDSSEYIAVTRRIENIQRNTNNIQIANLTEEIKSLKAVTKDDAKWVRIAIYIAIATFLLAVFEIIKKL